MRYKPGHREESKERILAAVGRGFRRRGFEGIGVDGLAKEAAVTSGAFYGHFASKTEAFNEALTSGLRELHGGITTLQTQHGDAWLEPFVDFYLTVKRTCDLGDACAFQTLTPEVIRSGDTAKQIYQTELLQIVESVARGLPQKTIRERRSHAWALLSILSGGVTTTRALADEAVAANAAKAIRNAALSVALN
jgi:TetR/AcrR family transcriptional regulator, transcriptional repressor for nem operon